MSFEDIMNYSVTSQSENYKLYKTKEEKIMSQNEAKSSMTIVVDDEQEITFNFFDVSNITKKGYKHDSNSGERYVIVGVGYNRKASSTVPMKEHDYQELKRRFAAFVENMGEHPENQQLRAINAVMADQISTIIKNSVGEHIDARNNISEQMIELQKEFGKKLQEYSEEAIKQMAETQKELDERLKSVDELFQKLSKVTNLVDDFLVAEETVNNEQEEEH